MIVNVLILCFFFLLNTVAAQTTENPNRQFSVIKNHYFSSRFDLAEEELRDFLKKYPDHQEAQELALKIKQWRLPQNTIQRQSTRTHLLENVENAWKQPNIKDAATQDNETQKCPKIPLIQHLKAIKLPSIQFKDLPLKEVVEILSDCIEQARDPKASPINILLMDPKAINPRVTLALKNLSLFEILKYITQSINFQFEIEKNAVVIKREEDIKPILDTKIFPINRYTVLQLTGEIPPPTINPETNLPHGQTLAQEETSLKNFFSRAGIDFEVPKSTLAFDGTQLIVTQTPKNLQRIKNILAHYTEIKQVQIEAKFLEVQQGALEEIGFKWNMGKGNHAQFMTGNDTANNLRSLNTFAKQTYTSGNGTAVINQNAITIPNNAPNFPNTMNTGANSTPVSNILGVLNGYQMNFVMQALEQQSGSDLMSAPRITVLSGKRAEIVVAQEMRYPQEYTSALSNVGSGYSAGGGSAAGAAGVTITAGTPSNFAVRNVGVQMAVTPTVQQDHQICLKLEPCVTEFEGFVEYGGSNIAISGSTTIRSPSGYFQPIFSTRRINTEVIIENQATVVMGGLTREEVKEVHDRVPILGNLPVLGRLFQSKGETSQKRNLLIFVTASLLSTKGHSLHHEEMAQPSFKMH